MSTRMGLSNDTKNVPYTITAITGRSNRRTLFLMVVVVVVVVAVDGKEGKAQMNGLID